MFHSDGSRAAWSALALVGTATFMAALDGSVVNVALPVIRKELGGALSSMEWVVSAYLLCICSLLLPFGRLADLLGHGRMMGLGFLLFGLASLGCGASPTLDWLVGTRALQGVGAAMLMASGPALISSRFPPEQRGRALGLIATATYAGLSVGPSLGGFITGTLGWRWVFWLNVPLVIAGTRVSARMLRGREPHRSARDLDVLGALLFAGAICAFIVALEGVGGSSRPAALVQAGCAAALFGLFLFRQQRSSAPLVPLSLFARPAFSASVAAAFLQYAALFIASFLMPFFLQGPLGLSPQRAGGLMTVQPVCMVALSAFAGWVSDRVGPRLPATLGMLSLASGLWLFRSQATGPSLPVTGLSLALMGVGAGLFTTPNNSAMLGAAPRERLGVASGLLAATRNVGMVTGVALAGLFVAQAALEGSGPSTASSDEALRHALKVGLAVGAGMAAVGAVLSLLRPTPGTDAAS